MKDIEGKCKVALVQAEPVLFDKKASLKKTLDYIGKVAAEKPDLIVFLSFLSPGILLVLASVSALVKELRRAERIGNAIMTLLLWPEVRSFSFFPMLPKRQVHI